MNIKSLVVYVVLWRIRRALTQVNIPTTPLRLGNMLKMQQGLGWPHNLTVTVGHEAHMSLTSSMDNEESCTVSTPFGLSFNVDSPPDSRYRRWSEGCGVQVSNVAETDEGRWRLTSTRGNYTLTGWTQVRVKKPPESDSHDIQLQDGETNTNVLLSNLDNSYCFVAQPFSESSLVAGRCSVTLDRTTRAVQGSWNVLLGIPGRVEELRVQRQVTVHTERLDVGYTHNTAANKLHLYCNIQHTKKNITFCRFQRTDAALGFNLVDGLSDGNHSYYGEGFLMKQCGVTVEGPTAQDYSTWRCSVGVTMWSGNQIVEQSPMQALISVAPPSGYSGFSKNLFSDELGDKNLIVEEGRIFTIMCRAHVSLSYCWFQHPNGTQFTPGQLVDEEQLFWYTGESLQTGDCGVTFSHATSEQNGLWTCHMGPRDQKGIEITDTVNLRVTGPLAASRTEIRANSGDEVTLFCHTSNGNRPLQYCRFLSPRFVGLNIDDSITRENPILGRYYFTPDRHIDFGDCSLTISSIQAEDFGVWTCAALIDEDSTESRDTIRVRRGSGLLSQAGVIGMSTGFGVLVIIIIVVVVCCFWPKRRNSRRPAPPSQHGSEAEIVSMHSIHNEANASVGRPSIESNISSSSESIAFSAIERRRSNISAPVDVQSAGAVSRRTAASVALSETAPVDVRSIGAVSRRTAGSGALAERIPSVAEERL